MNHQRPNTTLPLSPQELAYLGNLSNCRSGSVLRVRRAAMLLKYAEGVSISKIAKSYRCSTVNVEQNIDKALRQEVFCAREKDYKKHVQCAVTPEMMDWVRALSCQNPRNLGYSCVEWPASLLAQHVRDHCRAAGYHALAGLRCTELAGILVQDTWHPEMAGVGG